MNNIRFFNRKDIDSHRWDELINNAVNSLPYALSWYLDAVAENWGAFVLNDFEAVMPVVWLRKLGIKCVYQPYYCQQLGVFSIHPVTASVYSDFLHAVSGRFSYVNTNLNPSAIIVAGKFGLIKKKNLLLGLDNDYAAIQKKYTTNHRRNIAKAHKAALSFSEQWDLKGFQKFYLGNVNHNKEKFKPQHERIFKKLTQTIIANNRGTVFTVCDSNNNLQAAALLVSHNNRLTGIINTSSADGKKQGASHFLFDQIIRKFAGTGAILDFEGSSIVTIARFYEGFGATEETFFQYKNTLLKNISQRFA